MWILLEGLNCQKEVLLGIAPEISRCCLNAQPLSFSFLCQVCATASAPQSLIHESAVATRQVSTVLAGNPKDPATGQGYLQFLT